MQGGATVFDDLPECLVVHEILARMPVKDVLRCRAARKSWRSGTSTTAFILDHRRRQPSLPIIQHGEGICRLVGASNDLKIRPVLRYASDVVHRATCDGLIILSREFDGLVILSREFDFYVCNPVTRKWASLPHPPRRPDTKVSIAGFYRHHTSEEYRVLWVSYPILGGDDVAVELLEYLVLTVGSDQPRCVQWPTVSEQWFIPAIWSYQCPPVHHRGNLHWSMGLNITVFDTIAEIFSQMSRPKQLGDMVPLMDMGGALALCHTTHDCRALNVWMLQDYDAEMWGFQYRINLLPMEATPPLNFEAKFAPKMSMINERELLIAQRPGRLLHCVINGVFLGNVETKELEKPWTLTRYRLQENMISLSLFEIQKEAASKEPPFVIVL